jgi:type IV pilus assembly protein PilO
VALDLKQLESKPWYWGLGIGLAIAVVLYLAVTFYVPPNFNEMRDTIAKKKNEISALEEKINQGRAAERRLPQLREEVRRIELDLQRLLQILPTRRNVEELIKKVEALTRQGDFFLKSFVPKPYINKDFYAEWPIDIQLDGTYHNLALFFDKLARFSRIINVEDLVMTGYPDASGGRTLGATFTAKTFIYLGDKEEPVDAKKGPGGPGAGRPPAGPKPAGG